MHILPEAFAMLSLAGVWLPTAWKSKGKIVAYKMFSFVIVCLMNSLVWLQLSSLLYGDSSTSQYSELLYTILTVSLDCCRALNYVLNRERIIDLADMLRLDCCAPRNVGELRVQRRTDAGIRRLTILFNLGIHATIAGFMLAPLVLHKGEHVLPDQLWLPYDLRPSWNFWLTYGCEALLYRALGSINVNDCCVVGGFMLQACAQLEILSLRVDEMARSVGRALDRGGGGGDTYAETLQLFQRKALANVVSHHLYILKYCKKVTKTFAWTIVMQFIVVSMIITFIVYKLIAMKPGSFGFFSAIAYLASMTAGFFCVCWCGNQVTLKGLEFSDNIYKVEWMFLNPESQKKLMFIIQRSSKPIVTCCGHFIILNIPSFKGIIKLSYSAFNFLRS